MKLVANVPHIVVVLLVMDVIVKYDSFFLSDVVNVSELCCRDLSSKGNPSICFLKLGRTGAAFFSISILETLLNGCILSISVFVQMSFL